MVLYQIVDENFKELAVFLLLSLELEVVINVIYHRFEWFQSVKKNKLVLGNISVSLLIWSLVFLVIGGANFEHEEEPLEVVQNELDL